MRTLLATIVVLAVSGTTAVGKPPGEITYEPNPDGSGFTFYRLGQRVAYSKAVDRTTRTLFICANRALERDIPILAVNDRMALWFNALYQSNFMPIEADEKKGVVSLLRQKPDPKMAGKKFALPRLKPGS
jgi:hypothetical protein